MMWQFLPSENDWKWYFQKKYLKWLYQFQVCATDKHIWTYYSRRYVLCSRDRVLPIAHVHFTREKTQYWILSKNRSMHADRIEYELFSLNRTSLVDAVEWRHRHTLDDWATHVERPTTRASLPSSPPLCSQRRRLEDEARINVKQCRRRRLEVSSSGSVLKRSN